MAAGFMDMLAAWRLRFSSPIGRFMDTKSVTVKFKVTQAESEVKFKVTQGEPAVQFRVTRKD